MEGKKAKAGHVYLNTKNDEKSERQRQLEEIIIEALQKGS